MHFYLVRSPASNVILLLMGLVLVGLGLYNIISHYLLLRKPYDLVSGKITSYEKEIHRVKYHKTVYYFPTLEFEYNKRTYTVRDPNGLREDVMDSYEKYVGDTVEIRVPRDDPYSAMLNFSASINKKYKEGALYLGIGLFVVFVAASILILH